MLHEFAPAKLNLYLHVLGRDERGYHLLDSLVAFADIGDQLIVMPAKEFSLQITGLFSQGLEADERNLVWRAAIALGHAVGQKPQIAVTLVKNLPVASGIGGGSSDAAAMLRVLCRLWRIDPADPRVMQVARSLGSDVPVCVLAQACFMSGTGEILEVCPSLPSADLVLVNPGVPVPTKDVFAARTGSFSVTGRFDASPADASALATILHQRHNGLQEPAIHLAPLIQTVLNELRTHPGCLLARMLGSGATCFGLFGTRAEAQVAARGLQALYPEWWVSACRLKEIALQDA